MSARKDKVDCYCNGSEKQGNYNDVINKLGKKTLKMLDAGSGAKIFNDFLNYFFNTAGEMYDRISAKRKARERWMDNIKVDEKKAEEIYDAECALIDAIYEARKFKGWIGKIKDFFYGGRKEALEGLVSALNGYLKAYDKPEGLGSGAIEDILDDSTGSYCAVDCKCGCQDETPPLPPVTDPVKSPQRCDPLALDLDGDGKISTVDVNDSKAYLDVDGDGIQERIGWVAANDGLLFYDRNENGAFDGLSELFGKADKTGFEELAEYDLNNDGIIDLRDEIFHKIKVWQDKNGDGIIQQGELKTFDELGITGINLDSVESSIEDNGNLVIESGSFIKNGEKHFAGSMEFRFDNRYNRSTTEVDPISKMLPKLWGFGDVVGSQHAYAEDEDFKNNVLQCFIYENKPMSINQFLYQWTRLDKVHEKMGIVRENYELTLPDKVWIYEKFLGSYAFSRLVEESGFSEIVFIVDSRVTIINGGDESLIDPIKEYYAERLYVYLLMEIGVKGISYNYKKDKITVDEKEFVDSYKSLTSEQINKLNLFELGQGEYVTIGYDGGKIIIGNSENKDIQIDSNSFVNHIIIPGKSREYEEIRSGYGDDIFIYNRGDGKKSISDVSGNDTIYFGKGITKEDLLFTVTSQGSVCIGLKKDGITNAFDLEDNIVIRNYFEPYSYILFNGCIENMIFADGSSVSFKNFGSYLGTSGNDFIKWSYGSVNIDLGDGNDYLETGDYDNIITGGKGDDTIYTGTGDDTFIYNRGDGSDCIHDRGGNDTLIFGEGITKEDLFINVCRDGSIIIYLKEDGITDPYYLKDKIRIYSFLNSRSNQTYTGYIENIKFADGSSITLRELANLQGTSLDDDINWKYTSLNINLGDGNDIIYTGDYDNVITGGKGDDRIYTGTGNDTFIYNRGDGKDYIEDSGGNDTIIFGEGITKEDLVIAHNYSNLLIGLREKGISNFYDLKDIIEITDFYDPDYDIYSSGCIENIKFADGSSITLQELANLQATSMDDDIYWKYTPLNIDLGDGDDDIVTGNYDNIIKGGKGDDYISTGTGDDTFIYNRGDGRDIIRDKGGNDTLIFGEGITKEDLLVSVDNYNGHLYIGLREEGVTNIEDLNDRIKISDYLSYYGELSAGCIENIKFADGSTITFNDFGNLMGTSGNDSVRWDYSPLEINLGDGNDRIYTGDYDNVITGGKGNDSIYTGIGNDTFIYNRGDGKDFIYDKGGDNTLIFGEGITKEDLIVCIDRFYGELYIGLHEEGVKNPQNLKDAIKMPYYYDRYSAQPYKVSIENYKFADGSVLTFEELLKSINMQQNNNEFSTYYFSKNINNTDNLIDTNIVENWKEGVSNVELSVNKCFSNSDFNYLVQEISGFSNDTVVYNFNEYAKNNEHTTTLIAAQWSFA